MRAVTVACLATLLTAVGAADAGLQFTPRQAGVPIESASLHMVAADFDGDGHADLLSAGGGRATWLIAAPDQPSGFAIPQALSVGRVPSPPAVAEPPGGGVDFAIVDADAGGFWFGTYDGGPEARFHPFRPYPVAIALADWNGDGLTDVAIGHSRRGLVTLLGNDGASPPGFVFLDELVVGADLQRLLAIDADRDGRPDLVATRDSDAGTTVTSLFHSRGGGGRGPAFDPPIQFSVAARATSVGTTDADGDGYLDFVFLDANRCRPNSSTVLVRGESGSTLDHPLRSEIPCPFFSGGLFCPSRVQIAGDWNGDGLHDLAVFLTDPRLRLPALRGEQDALQIFASSGATFLSGPVSATPRQASAAIAGDFNGDGAVDIAASFAASNQIVLYENRSTPGYDSNGAPCTSAASCLSGFCIEGLCCASVCRDDESCALPLREGTCQRSIIEVVPCALDDECFDIPDPGDPGTCVAGFCCDQRCEDGRCDIIPFEGKCLMGYPGGSDCCADRQCESGFCRDGRCCESDCEGGYCGNDAGECAPVAASGQACEVDDQCGSRICDRFDRVCCGAVCGPDETCNGPDSPGRCVLLGCDGDCDGDAEISVDELVRGVRIVLGENDVGDCESMDSNRDGAVTVDELTAAVRRLLEGCVAA